ncbi:DUF4119 family protein [Bacteroides thetaiotaomicron]|uniref:DUF4119 family protein n=1 Tax=Bacteroides thetaiotaomicron TaxID=818 RepID=UPI00293D6897|nr:DUF4119 family protein [Bacteroides thetaiotaomicron]
MRSEKKWLTGEKKHYFIACLRTYYEDDEFNSYVKSLTGLGQVHAEENLLRKHTSWI